MVLATQQQQKPFLWNQGSKSKVIYIQLPITLVLESDKESRAKQNEKSFLLGLGPI
jgi:hypothetical protein